MSDAEEMSKDTNDTELADMAQAEIKKLKPQIEDYENRLTVLLLPSEPNDDKDVIVEIRGGAGGDEAALFAGDLFRMYTRYADTLGWHCEILDSSATGLGGFKEVVFQITGNGVYSRMLIAIGLVESIPIIAAVIAIVLVFANPFVK